MTIASGSNHGIAYVQETTRGVTPANPSFKTARNTGSTIGLSKDSLQSEELRQDRQISCFKHGNSQVGGDIPAELAYSDFDDFLEAGLGGTWSIDDPEAGTDRLEVGTERRYFTVERNFSDIGNRIRYTGCEVNTIAISVAPNAITTVTFGFVGEAQDPDNAELAGATYAGTSGGCPFDSFNGSIMEGGAEIGVVTQVDLNVDNGLEALFVVGSSVSIDSSIGRSNVTGNLTVYFESMDLLNKFINEDNSSLELELIDEGDNAIKFILGNISYSSGQPDVSGDGSVTLSMDFQALLSANEGTNLAIERTPMV